MYSLNIGLVIGSKDLLDEVQAALYELPVRVVLEQREAGDVTALIEKIEKAQPDVIILGLHQLVQPLPEFIRQLRACSGSPMVVIVNPSNDPEIILRCIRSGAHEYVYPPLKDDLRAALERMAAERVTQRAGTRPRGKVFAFLSAKGGAGATTIACHVAVELHRQTHLEVLLGDFDLDNGIVGFLMKAQSRYSVLDAVDNAGRLDLSLWKALVSNGFPGVEVIVAPSHSVLRSPVSHESLRQLVPFIRANYDWTVLDLGTSLSHRAVSVLEEVDETYIVTVLEIPALHQTKQIIQALLDASYPREKIRLLINRMPKRSEVTLDELDRMLGVPIYATLPNEYHTLIDAYSEGGLVPAKSGLGKQFARVAGRIAGSPDAARAALAVPKKKGFSVLGL